jgi:hypothetical protein
MRGWSFDTPPRGTQDAAATEDAGERMMAMLRPGLHFHNGCGITPADMDLIRRWTPLSLLLAMEGVVESQTERLRDAWELAGRPPLVLRRYYEPREGGDVAWGAHANESMELARRCIRVGIPQEKLILKPFNEPNMPRWAQWEGFGDQPADMARYNEALLLFIYMVRRDLPGVRIGGPHLTVGNRDVRFPNDPEAVYYYHGKDGRLESSPCHDALSALDVHFVHTYGMAPGEYADRAHGLRFLEYEKYLQGKDIYVVEGAYGINSGQAPDQNTVRGQETVAYLKLLGEKYPQVKGVALWIGGDPGAGWFAFCHSNGPNPESHRPVVYAVEAACKADGAGGGSFDTPPAEPTQDAVVEPEPEPATGVEWKGVSEAMKGGVTIAAAPKPSEAHWKVTRVEVQPETDKMVLYAVLPVGAAVQVRFSWAGGEHFTAPKADPYEPEGAREWAASMPMFAPWGAYAVEVVGNSENVSGLGLYGSDLDPRYKGHHPVLVYFERVAGGSCDTAPAEPTQDAAVEPGPEEREEEEPGVDTQLDVPYKLVTAFARHGIPDVVDLRNEIESFSNMPELEKLWRPFSMLRLVVVHHSGSDLATQTPISIARYHVEKVGGATIPYHFCVDFEGRLYFTARLCWRLPHSGKDSTNAEGVGVCMLGNYEKQQPTDKQIDTLRRLIWLVLPEFVGGGWGLYRGLYVIPHGRLVKTLCPGANLLDALIYRGQWPVSFDTAATQPTQDAFFRGEQAGE